MSHRNTVAQLYPQALVYLFSSYDSQGNGGGIQIRLKVKVKVTLRLTISQSVCLGVEPHLGLMTGDLLLFDKHGRVVVGRPH
jgi:hypothetical protein